MRFSIYLNPQTRGAFEDVEIIRTVTNQAIWATRSGFDGIALTEHHFSDYNTYGNPFMLASYLIRQVPPRTMFTLACAVPPLHNPMRLAQSANLLDILTNGNAIIGVAPGGSPLEYSGVGREPEQRGEEFFKTMEIVETVIGKQPDDPPFEWSTAVEHGTVHTRLMPGSLTTGGPRFARATQNDEGVAWTGRKGWYLLTARDTPDVFERRLSIYEAALRESDLEEADIQHRLDWSFVQKQIYVTDSVEKALEETHPRLDLLAENQKRAFSHVSGVKSAGELKSVVGVAANDHDEFIKKGLILGDPDTVADEIRRYRDAGVRHMALVFNWGYMSPEESTRSLELFLEHVLPQVRDAATVG